MHGDCKIKEDEKVGGVAGVPQCGEHLWAHHRSDVFLGGAGLVVGLRTIGGNMMGVHIN